MGFSLEEIRKNCIDEQSYQSGKALMKDSRLDSVQSFWKGEVTIQADVSQGENREKVSFVLKDGEYNSYSCTCGESGKGLCRHVAAASLLYYQLIHKSSSMKASTSPAMQRILREYTNLGIAAVMEGEAGGKVELQPVLHKEGSKLYVTFKIANEKKAYVIKDITEFYHHMQNQDSVEYGRSLSFVHSPWAFKKSGLPLLEFVLHAVRENLEYYKMYNPYRAPESMKQKELYLTRANTDRFFELNLNQRIPFSGGDGIIRTVVVAEENPVLSLKLTEELGSFQAALNHTLLSMEGEERLYVADKDRIYCCSQEFSRDMKSFLKEAGGGKIQPGYTIHARDMPAFLSQFLPVAQKWLQVDWGGLDLEQYRPIPVEVSFSFDVNEEKAVVCEEKISYGDFSFNPVVGVSVPVHINRDYPGEYKIRSIVEKYFRYYDLDSGLLMLYEEEEIFRLLEEGMDEFMELGQVYVSEAFKAIRVMSPPAVSVGVSLNSNLLEITLDSGGLDEEELMELLKHYRMRKKFYRLRQGEFIKIEDTALAALSEVVDSLKLSGKELLEDKAFVPANRAMYLEQVLSQSGRIAFQRNKEFKGLVRSLKNIEDSDFEVPESLKKILRGYQKTGYRFLRTLSRYGFGGILADEMGLGKTLQVITLLLAEKDKLGKPAIIICPASLVYNWENELKRFAPRLSVLIVTGSAQEREALIRSAAEYQVLITSYDLLKRDFSLYASMEFTYEIIDEAQVIKNHSTQSARAVKDIKANTRFALTGTPIENRLSELWSIFDYLMPGYLFSYRYFKEEFETPIIKNQDEIALRRLKGMLKPFVLRRLKSDVLKELPQKLETVVYSGMEGEQKKLYLAGAAKLRNELSAVSGEEFKTGRIQILAALTRLRQICCDPSLCYEGYQEGSAKLSTCLELMEEGVEAGHRILLFSQFTAMLDIIKKKLQEKGISYFLLTGSTPKKERVDMASQFNQGEKEVFLISLKAGGTGLNLTGADVVIHYDPWWNIAAENQATDRAHRIGQKNMVSVVKLVAKGTIEENILKLQEKKRDLARQVIGEGEGGLTFFSQEELMELLDNC